MDTQKSPAGVQPHVFKSYDVRGKYGTEITEELAESIGRAFVKVIDAKRVAVGRDMRSHSPALEKSMLRGIAAAGCDVISLGQCSTPMTYFAVSNPDLNLDGAVMITASHNPGPDNGFKFSKRGGEPMGDGAGLEKIKELVLSGEARSIQGPQGKQIDLNILPDWCDYLKKFLPKLRPMKIVLDFGNGVMGPIIRELLKKVDPSQKLDIIWLFEEPDGTFPWHPADPLKPLNLQHLQGAVLATKADFGVAFDGDGDRLAFVDGNGKFIGCDLMTAIFARELLSQPGVTARNVMFDLRCSAVVPKEIRKAGGIPEMCRVGHSHIKAAMRGKRQGTVRDPSITGDVIFAGEISGHFFFKDCFYCDSSERAFLLGLQLMTEEKRTLAQIVEPLRAYHQSGELNYKLPDAERMKQVLPQIRSRFAKYEIYELDGISVESPEWQLNVRLSNTEPVVRVAVETFESKAKLEELVSEIEEMIFKLGGSRYLR